MSDSRTQSHWRFPRAGALIPGLVFCLSCQKNHAPMVPASPDGPSVGARDSLYVFTAITTDPDGDGVCYRFAWGDGDTSAWTLSVQRGQPGEASHQWRQTGVFEVTAQAKDASDNVSTWSPGHELRVADIWSRAFGGTNGDNGSSVQPTSDGGYIVTGYTYSYGAGVADVWLVKTDATGNKLWDKTFGGADNDWGNSVQTTSDGGYIIAGYTYSYGAGGTDLWLIKTDASGNRTWDKTLGGTSLDYGNSVQPTFDGGYIIAGYTYSYGAGGTDVWLVKTDAAGNKLWDKTFGGTDKERGNSVQSTSDGGYIIVGYTVSYGAGGADVWLVKTDANGDKLWDKTFGGTDNECGNSVQPTSDGGYVVAGYTASYGAGNFDVWLIKTDASGNKLWDKTFGGTNGDGGNSVQPTSDSGFVITGYTDSYGAGYDDVWLIKTDASGR